VTNDPDIEVLARELRELREDCTALRSDYESANQTLTVIAVVAASMWSFYVATTAESWLVSLVIGGAPWGVLVWRMMFHRTNLERLREERRQRQR
jgi:hypothetical protein